VRFERRGAVALLTFDRPEARNAMTWAMYDQLAALLERLDPGDGVRVAVFRGAGGSFVAGTDIGQFREFGGEEDGVAYEKRLDAIIGALEAVPVPTLAVVEGYAVGGGLAIAAACDLRVCTPDARFGLPIARTVGNCLSIANHARLLAHLGPGRTKALLLLARYLAAEEARAAGFVLEVVEGERLDARVAELCERLAAHAPVTLQVTKEAIRRITRALSADGEDLVRRAYGSRDFREGVSAFLEKREPRWEGR
jgi:enoyl-CoA hydratase/carnithine racemase